MGKMMGIVVTGLMIGWASGLWAEDEQPSPRSKFSESYNKNLIHNRADKYEDTGGVSDSGHWYRFWDRKKIDAVTRNPASTGKVDIGSTTISKGSRIRSVDTVVTTDKQITVRTGGKPTEVNVGNVVVEKDAIRDGKVKINTYVDAPQGISVKP